MNILFVIPYAPTLIRTRPYNLVRGLARRGNNVTLATLWENETERAALTRLERDGIHILSARLTKPRAFWNMLCALPTATPLQAVYCWQPKLVRLINSQFVIHNSPIHNSPFDIIHIEHLRGACYGLAIRNSQFAIPIVWDSVDCISYLFEQAARHSRSPFGRIVTRFELARTRRYEAMLVNRFERVLVTSPVDAAALKDLVSSFKFQVSRHLSPATRHSTPATLSPGHPVTLSPCHPVTLSPGHPITRHPSPVAVLPNGVALDYFTPADAPRDPETIAFTGKMSYHANVTAALHLVNDIMPRVWRERPTVRVNIVGQNPPRSLSTDHRPLITVTGSVPDVPPYLQRAALAVAPMSYGAGIQNKVLEAMACATPVVASPQAVSALQVVDGEHLLIADGAEAFARQVLRLLEDAALRQRIGQAARRYAEEHHDWKEIVRRLEQIYREAIAEASTSPDFTGLDGI